MTINKALALRITNLMIKNNITAYRVAVNAGLQHSTLQNILDEKYVDSKVSTIIRIAYGFNMTLQEFLNDDLFSKANLDVE